MRVPETSPIAVARAQICHVIQEFGPIPQRTWSRHSAWRRCSFAGCGFAPIALPICSCPSSSPYCCRCARYSFLPACHPYPPESSQTLTIVRRVEYPCRHNQHIHRHLGLGTGSSSCSKSCTSESFVPALSVRGESMSWMPLRFADIRTSVRLSPSVNYLLQQPPCHSHIYKTTLQHRICLDH